MIKVIAKLPDVKTLYLTLKSREQIQTYRDFGLIGIHDEEQNTTIWVSPENLAIIEESEEIEYEFRVR